jgi:hypothetical protein
MEKVWSTEEWERLSLDERHRLASWIWRLIESDVREALEFNTLGMRVEAHTSRTVSVVDERGWLELNRIQNEALWATLAAKAESAERLAESGEEGFPALSAMLCFELASREGEQKP